MITKKIFEKGHKKTIVRKDVNLIIKEFVRDLKKQYSTQASFQIIDDEIEIKLHGHHDVREK